MISTAIAITIGIVQAGAGDEPADRRQRRRRMHDRRVKPRGAIGKPHGTRFRAAIAPSQQPLDLVDQRAGAGSGDPHASGRRRQLMLPA